MKKICLLFLFLVFSCVTCYATETTIISLQKAETDIANEIIINIQISDNSKACGGKIDLVYDETLLKPESYQVGSVLSNSTCLVNLNYEKNLIRVSWAGTEELIASGTLCTLKFAVITDENFSTDVDIKQLKIADINSEPISVNAEKCTIVYIKESNTTSSRPHVSSNGITPSKDVITEQVVNKETSAKVEFSDVKENDWFYDSVQFVNELGYMSGISETEFAPKSNLTRAMLVTILYRMENSPECGEAPFTDVESDVWYSKGVAWASENGIVNGVGNGLFEPNSNITREQIAVIFYNYTKMHELDISYDDNLNVFKDVAEISDWANTAMKWAVGTDLITGKGSGILDAKGNATRAEIATILKRYIENKKTS